MIDVLIPVLGRPQSAQPLIDSLACTQAPYRTIFLCSPGDRAQIKACQATGAETWVVDWEPGPGDFAKKINWAFDQTSSEWVFQGADDIRFWHNWDWEALECARRKRKSVIGTNDRHNPSVRRRMHSTHTLFRREYIERYGSGTDDNSGRVFCELYDHQFVDTEFCETAMLRHEWAFAARAFVEHFHPHWGNAEMDATYEKALRATDTDMQLYRSRSRYYDFRRGRRRVRA